MAAMAVALLLDFLFCLGDYLMEEKNGREGLYAMQFVLYFWFFVPVGCMLTSKGED